MPSSTDSGYSNKCYLLINIQQNINQPIQVWWDINRQKKILEYVSIPSHNLTGLAQQSNGHDHHGLSLKWQSFSFSIISIRVLTFVRG